MLIFITIVCVVVNSRTWKQCKLCKSYLDRFNGLSARYQGITAVFPCWSTSKRDLIIPEFLFECGVFPTGADFFMRTKTMSKIHDSHVIFF